MIDDGWPVGEIACRLRVITDNDYGGDPDGLVELAHARRGDRLARS